MNPTKTRRHSLSLSLSLSQSAAASPIETLINFHSAESRDWASLTDAALHSVLSRLDSLEDLFAFRAVCRSWRSLPTPSPALSAQAPLILLPRFPSLSESFYDLLRRRLYTIRLPWSPPSRRSLTFSHGFLITVSAATEAGPSKLLLWNLLSGARIRLPKSPRNLPRVILSSSPVSSACSVVCFRPSSRGIQFCCLGDRLWKFHFFYNSPIIRDMIFFCGRLYALTPGNCLAAVDLVPRPELTLLGSTISDVPDNDKYGGWVLAKSGGNLLLVGLNLLRGFSVYRWDFEGGGGGWQKLTDLGGRALFLENRRFTASVVPTCSAVKGNYIYYVGCLGSVYYEFSLEDQSLSTISLHPCSSLPHHPRADVPKIWVFPSLCCL